MIWNKLEAITYISNLKDDAIIEAKQKQNKSTRSLAQNKYYFWVVVNVISDFHGYTPVETHELLKVTFDLKTTTWLDTSEFKFMCEMIIDMWATKYQVRIPLPEDSWMEASLFKGLWF